MGTIDIKIKAWFSPNQSVDKKNRKFFRVFGIISHLDWILTECEPDIQAYFPEKLN